MCSIEGSLLAMWSALVTREKNALLDVTSSLVAASAETVSHGRKLMFSQRERGLKKAFC
jgi:hypothetical protein